MPDPSYDITTGNPMDKVRLRISDVGGEGGNDFLFSNEEINSFLDDTGGSVGHASALALRTIAGNEAMVSKRIDYLGLKTDGPAVAKALMDLATAMDSAADAGDDDAWDPVIEMVTEPFGRRQQRLGF